MTIRKSGGRRTRLWELGDSANPTIQKLETVYLSGLDAVDRTEARHAADKTDPRFNARGRARRSAEVCPDQRGACSASGPDGHQESARRGVRIETLFAKMSPLVALTGHAESHCRRSFMSAFDPKRT